MVLPVALHFDDKITGSPGTLPGRPELVQGTKTRSEMAQNAVFLLWSVGNSDEYQYQGGRKGNGDALHVHAPQGKTSLIQMEESGDRTGRLNTHLPSVPCAWALRRAGLKNACIQRIREVLLHQKNMWQKRSVLPGTVDL